MFNHKRRSFAGAAAAAMVTGMLSPVAVGLAGSGAEAKQCDEIRTTYKTARGEAVWKPTGLAAGHYQRGGTQSLDYGDGKQRAKSKGSSDSVGGDAGVNFGLGSASLNYNRTWDRSTTTSTSKSKNYTTNSRQLPADAFTRWTLYHKAYRFKVTVTVTYNSSVCPTKKHRWMVVVPTKSWSEANLHWDVQYQSHPGRLYS